MAHIVIAYLCWFFGGIFGLHHFYLGRDKHALVWWMSLGGLSLGWFRDLWRLPEYLYEANKDPRVKAAFRARRQQHEKPPWKVARFAGQMFIGMLLGYLFRLAIPEKVLDDLDVVGPILKVILPIPGVSLGVYLVSNIGIQKVAYRWCLLGALFSLVLLLQEKPPIEMAASCSTVLACYKVEWDIEREPPEGACTFIKRVVVLSILGCLYLCLWTSVIYYNVHITTGDGVQVPIHEAVENFFQSPAWKEFKSSMYMLKQKCEQIGWDECYFLFIERIDPTGETHAYKVLGFETKYIKPEEIQSRCRKLSRQYHPDKFKTEKEKAEAQEKFIEVQKACDILNDMRRRRADKNMESDRTPKSSSTNKHKPRTEF
ncbi:TM2 domain [Mactra antiquata]